MAKKRVETVTGYGVRLRARLKAAKMSQTELSRATRLSRQTIASALSDRVSEQTARLIDDVLRGSTARSRSGVWATATQISEWARRRESQEDLPRLVRRLVLATTADATSVSFRASEGVQLPGVDGRVAADRGSAFVPAGFSAWELGTSADPAAKATKDYLKRTESPGDVIPSHTTFIAVSARRWVNKDEWVAQRRAERSWKDVRVYDADDLEAWLEVAPSVHLWFSKRIGVIPQDCIDLESWWADWQGATNPPLTANFLLSGRAGATGEIVARLVAATRVLPIRAESQGEAIAVFAATLAQGQAIDRDAMFARSVVVETESAWRHLVAAKSPLILIPTFELGDLISSAMGGGHTVVLPSGPGDAELDDMIDIGVIAREPVVEILRPSNSGTRNDAWEQAALARRSMTAFRRSIAIAPSLRKPAWAQAAVARRLIAPLLVGSWNEAHEGDREALATLAAGTYDEVVGGLLPFTNVTDPLLRRHGSLWYLVSPQDAWRQIGAFLTREDLDRFQALALETLEVVDPRLDLATDKRWMAGVLLPPPKRSPIMRRGIAETIGLLGSRGGTDEPGIRNEILVGFADGLVHRLFSKVRREPRLWASIGDQLPDLAEGAPEVFLRELEQALGDPSNPLVNIFTDSESDPLFAPSSPHVDVLWALERLAWSPRYLGRVASILGRLDAIDPKGRMVNRPAATLRAIFLPWLPQTSATVDQRLDVLDRWSVLDGRAARITLVSMLPEVHGVGHYSSRPRWHDWCPDESQSVSHGEYWKSVRFAASKLVWLAGTDPQLWTSLLAVLAQFPEPERQLALEKLGQLDPSSLTEAEQSAIWNGLRTLVAHHRTFAGAAWALPPERVSAIDALRDRFSPKDIVSRFSWLFQSRPELPDAVSRFDDFAAYDAELATQRKAAVSEIVEEAGLEGLDAVANGAEEALELGLAMGRAGPLTDEDSFIAARLAHEQRGLHHFAWGYLGGRVSDLGEVSGRDWLLGKFSAAEHQWTPTQRALLLLGTRPAPDLWLLAAGDDAVAQEYWTRLNPFLIEDENVSEAVEQYLAHKRSFAAVALLAMHVEKRLVTPSRILDVLEAAVFGEPEDKPDGMFSFYVGKLFDAIGEVNGTDEMRVARLELGLLPAISQYERTPRVLTRVMLREPSLFVDAITLVYKPRNAPNDGQVATDADAHAMAARAYELLHTVRGIPGTGPDGAVSPEALNAWVDQARAELAKRDRVETGLQEIARLIGSSPNRGSDGVWPCEPVRDLIERLASDDFEQGMQIGLYNSRGVTTRAMTTGGAPERALANQYRQYAKTLESRWYRTAGMLHSIAETYAQEATHHDLDVAVQEDLGS